MNICETTLRKTIPLVINVFNQHTYLKKMIDQFLSANFKNIYVIDNNSKYPALLDYYSELQSNDRVKVFYYNANRGPHYFFTSQLYKELFFNFPFLYTDPDLSFDKISDDFLSNLFKISLKYAVFKVGCALTLPNDSEINQANNVYRKDGNIFTIKQIEESHWLNLVEPNVYNAPIDTTFHLFNTPLYLQNSPLITGLRIAGLGMEAKHLPWFKPSLISDNELSFYKVQENQFTNWLA